MALQIKKAVRELIYTKIALMGPSGSGKTYSALRLAKGMAQELEKVQGHPSKILMLNTEASRGLYYANEFAYDIADINAPHSPEVYVEAINDAVSAGYDVLILDSSSPEWDGKMGCLEIQQLAGGTYQAWAKVTPRHEKFLNAIEDSSIHIITTAKGKDQYEMEKSDNGKVTVKKLGVGAIQRQGWEYQFSLTFLLDQQDNMAVVQKDNTHLFENEGRILLTESHGEKIIQWANSGEGYTPRERNVTPPLDALTSAKNKITELARELGGDAEKKDAMKAIFKESGISASPKGIKEIADEKVSKQLIEKLIELKENK